MSTLTYFPHPSISYPVDHIHPQHAVRSFKLSISLLSGTTKYKFPENGYIPNITNTFIN